MRLVLNRPVLTSGLLSLTLLLSQAASLAQQITLKPAAEVGQAWGFDQLQESVTNNSASANGQSQPFSAHQQSHHTGTAEILAVKDGLPTSLRIKFDVTSSDSTAMNDQPAQSVPFPYAGKTVTITRNDDGSVSDDFNGQADPSNSAELHSLLDEGAVFFPAKPISVGDEWPADPQVLSRALQLTGKETAGMTLKLLSVNDVAGHQVAEIKVSVAAIKFQGGIQSKVIMQGTSLVDVQTGQCTKSDLAGTIDLQGQQSSNGPDGNPVTYDIAGNGTISSSSTEHPLGGTSPTPAPTPAPAAEAPAVANNPAPTPSAPADSAINPLGAAATASFTGKFSDGKLTLDGTDSNGDFSGTLQLGDSKFPAKARINGQSLDGTFNAGGTSFPFTATLNGDTVNLTSGGKNYTLTRAAPVNPLAR